MPPLKEDAWTLSTCLVKKEVVVAQGQDGGLPPPTHGRQLRHGLGALRGGGPGAHQQGVEEHQGLVQVPHQDQARAAAAAARGLPRRRRLAAAARRGLLFQRKPLLFAALLHAGASGGRRW